MRPTALPRPAAYGTLVIGAILLTGCSEASGEADPATQRGALSWVERQRLAPTIEGFVAGQSVAIDRDTAAIGALDAVYVFTRNGTTWSEQARLDAAGRSLAVSGDTLLAGGLDGPARVFVRTGSSWTEQQTLSPQDGVDRRFGASVAISGDTAIVGGAGAYVFVRNGTTWTEQQRLVPGDTQADLNGASVSVFGNTALVGDRSDESGPAVAYAFVRTGTTWSEQHVFVLGASSSRVDGSAVSVFEDTALIGVPSDDSYRGALHVFTRSGAEWTEQQKLLPSAGSAGSRFGHSVSSSGDRAFVGTNSLASGNGWAIAFGLTDGGWVEDGLLIGRAGPDSNDEFGASVSVSGNTAIVSAVGESAAYIFEQRTNGEPCTSGADCGSGFCADGHCCDTECGGLCEACSVAAGASEDGTCAPLEADEGDCDVDASSSRETRGCGCEVGARRHAPGWLFALGVLCTFRLGVRRKRRRDTVRSP